MQNVLKNSNQSGGGRVSHIQSIQQLIEILLFISYLHMQKKNLCMSHALIFAKQPTAYQTHKSSSLSVRLRKRVREKMNIKANERKKFVCSVALVD